MSLVQYSPKSEVRFHLSVSPDVYKLNVFHCREHMAYKAYSCAQLRKQDDCMTSFLFMLSYLFHELFCLICLVSFLYIIQAHTHTPACICVYRYSVYTYKPTMKSVYKTLTSLKCKASSSIVCWQKRHV